MNNDELDEMVNELYDEDLINSLEFDVVGDNTTENTVFANLMKEDLNEALADLPLFERQVLEYRYGLNGNDRHTRSEIVKLLNSTIDKVRNAEDRAIKKLRHPKYSSKLRPYLDDIDTNIVK